MDFIKISAVFLACVTVIYAATTATISNKTPKVGEDVVLSCKTTPSLGRYVKHRHTKKFKENEDSIILADNLDLKYPALTQGRYKITSTLNNNVESYDLEIKGVKPEDSGWLGCEYVESSKNIHEKDYVKMIVQADGISVKYQEYQDRTDLDKEDFKDKEVKLTCVAKGYIPGDLKLFLSEKDITSQTKVIKDTTDFLKPEGNSGKSKLSWEKSIQFTTPFKKEDVTKDLICKYTTPGFSQKSVAVHLQSKTAKPHLVCNSTEVNEVKYGKSVEFSCTVNIKPELTNLTYSWEDADGTTYSIKKNENYKKEIYSIYKPDDEKMMAELILQIREVRFKHKNTKFTLFVSNAGGHSLQDFVLKNVAEVSASAHIVPSTLTILLAALVLIWRGL